MGSWRLGAQETKRKGAAAATPLRSRPAAARYEATLRKAGSPVVTLFDRVGLGKDTWENPAKKS